MSLLLISEILGFFLNTLSVHDMYSLRNRKNLPQQIQMLLPKKRKNFYHFFTAFRKFSSNLEYLGKKRCHSKIMYFRD